MWGYIISFALNLDRKVHSVGYFEICMTVCSFAVIFENCEFFGKSYQQHGGANLSSNLREETENFNAGQSPRVQLVVIISMPTGF